MLVKNNTLYKITTNDTKILVIKLYYQNDTKICFYGCHYDCNNVELEQPREYHLTLDKLKHWKEELICA